MMENRKLIIARLSQHVEELVGFTRGLTEQQLKARPGKDRWSLHELTAHLIETQDVFIERLTHMLVDEKPAILPFSADQARKDGYYLREDLTQRLPMFSEQRSTLVKLLETLTDEQWKLEGNHPEVHSYTVEKCMEALMRHEEHHLYQIYNVFFGTKD